MSLARQHFERTRAAAHAEAAASSVGAPADASAYEQVLFRLVEDKRRLKDIQSIERKIDAKRTLLPEYAPWVDGVLAANAGGQDAVLTTVMVWRLDVGDYDGALAIARYAIQHDLALPDQYQRTLPTLVAEEIADSALRGGAENGAPLATLIETLALTAERDMPDEVRAKLHKAIGMRTLVLPEAGSVLDAEGTASSTLSLQHLRRAMQLNPRSGVKREIERLERALRAAPAGSPAGESGAAPAASAGAAPAPATPSRKSTRRATKAPAAKGKRT